MESASAHPALKAFMCGSVSGTCSTLLFQPLDLIKTRLQTLQNNANAPKVGMFTVLINVIQKENFFSLWKGVSPSFVRCIPGVGIYFSTFYSLKQHYLLEREPNAGEAVLLGAGARAVAGICMLPFTVIKTRFESGCYNYGSVAGALRSVYETEGIRALFSGLTATLLRDAPFSGIYVMFYSQAKKALPPEVTSSPYAPLVNFSCGVAAGVMAALATQPADVVKTHIQISPSHWSTMDAIRYIYTEHGAVGVLPRGRPSVSAPHPDGGYGLDCLRAADGSDGPQILKSIADGPQQNRMKHEARWRTLFPPQSLAKEEKGAEELAETV
uniref:Solute carrier family 25 member 38b n=1 Tax=Gasterosteus aculeatus aculeatus TaxID=481459 RepID=G3Q6J8_GASAC